MEILWFSIIAYMITMYVILDGFDLGAGILHLLVARNDEERRTVLGAIGPVWDGNEVWLLAAGGSLFLAFPALYASSFSGFYLPLMIVLWLLMMRGLGIELRHHVHNPMWMAFWDAVFSIGSLLLAIFFGAALGNVVRGVPLDETGYFFEPLWTTFTVVPEAGILDWFTVTMGFVAFFTLTVHGANYLAMKTTGEVQQRSRAFGRRAWWGVLVTSIVAFGATWSIHPDIWDNYTAHAWGFIFPITGLAGLLGMVYFRRVNNDANAFLSSSTFIAGMLTSTAFGLFPRMLPSSISPEYHLTAYNTITGDYGLGVGVVWWTIGMAVALGYFTYLFYSFRGKVKIPAEGDGY